jgi:peptidoglycan/LPS O-acetylase OafA/YrhL
LHEDLFKLWAWDISFKGWYAPQLWTIPLEFKCSMVLFMVLLATARCTVFCRMAIEVSLMLYLFYVDRWDVATFIAGMFIAEINIIHDERKKAREAAKAAIGEAASEDMEARLDAPKKRRHPMVKFTKQLPLWCLFFFGYYLTGYPGSDAEHTPGYSFVTHFWAGDWDYKFRFFISIAAILLIFATSFLPAAQWFFTTPPARYLGKISYALYLIHVIMNRTLRYFLWHTFWNILKYESEEGDDAKFEGGWFLGTIIYVPCVLWAADIFWRMVDIPAVKFAKWVEEKCFVQEKR